MLQVVFWVFARALFVVLSAVCDVIVFLVVVVVVVKIEAGRRLCFGMVLCRWESVLFMSQLRKVLRMFGDSDGTVF